MDSYHNKKPLVILFFIAVGMFLKIVYISEEPYWLDEAYTRWFTSQSYYNLITWVPSFESHPPFYYVLAKTWNSIFLYVTDDSERWLSLVLLVPLYILSFKIHRILESSYISKVLTVSFISFSSIFNWYSIEARPYILFSVSYLLAIYGFYIALLRPRNLTAYTVLTIGIILTNWSHSTGPLLSLIIYMTLAVTLISKHNFNAMLGIILSTLVSFVFSTPLLLMLLNQVSRWSSSSWVSEPTLMTFLRTIEYLYIPLSGKQSIIFFLGFYIFSSALIIKKGNQNSLFLLVFSFVPPVISVVISFIGPNIFLNRTLIPVVLPFFIFMSLGIEKIDCRMIRYSLILVITAMLFYSSYKQFEVVSKEPWDEVYNELKSHSDQRVFVFPNSVELALLKEANRRGDEISVKALPYPYPAIGVSDFYPAGTPSVPGLRKSDQITIRKILKEGNEALFPLRVGEYFNSTR